MRGSRSRIEVAVSREAQRPRATGDREKDNLLSIESVEAARQRPRPLPEDPSSAVGRAASRSHGTVPAVDACQCRPIAIVSKISLGCLASLIMASLSPLFDVAEKKTPGDAAALNRRRSRDAGQALSN